MAIAGPLQEAERLGAGREARSARNGHPEVRPERSVAERRTPSGVGAESTCDKMGDHVGEDLYGTGTGPSTLKLSFGD